MLNRKCYAAKISGRFCWIVGMVALIFLLEMSTAFSKKGEDPPRPLPLKPPPVVPSPPGKPRLIIETDVPGGDPDGDLLQYEWFVYPEAGTHDGPVNLSGANREVCTVSVPEDAAGQTIHIILQATDDGAPPLTRYRRIVLAVKCLSKNHSIS